MCISKSRGIFIEFYFLKKDECATELRWKSALLYRISIGLCVCVLFRAENNFAKAIPMRRLLSQSRIVCECQQPFFLSEQISRRISFALFAHFPSHPVRKPLRRCLDTGKSYLLNMLTGLQCSESEVIEWQKIMVLWRSGGLFLDHLSESGIPIWP